MVLRFWCWLTQVVLEKRPLNGCSRRVYLSSLIKEADEELLRISRGISFHIEDAA